MSDGPSIHLGDNEDLQDHPHADQSVDVPDSAPQVTVDDDDAGECVWMSWWTVRDAYVDNQIVEIEPVYVDPWDLNSFEDETMTIRLSNGASLEVVLRDIVLGGGQAPDRYRKSGGIFYPTDSGGAMLFNDTTTPGLTGIKAHLMSELQAQSEFRLEMAELVNTFASAIGALGNATDPPFPPD